MNSTTRKLIEKRFGKIKIYRDGFAVSKALHRGGSGLVKPVAQEKPWGGEVWLIFTKRYAAKIMYFEKGKRFSLQKHKIKDESWLVLEGHPTIALDKKKFQAKPGMVFHCQARTIHRISASKDNVQVLEVSSPELHDAVRLADDFARTSKDYNPR